VYEVAESFDIPYPRTTYVNIDITFTLLWTVKDDDQHCGAHAH